MIPPEQAPLRWTAALAGDRRRPRRAPRAPPARRCRGRSGPARRPGCARRSRTPAGPGWTSHSTMLRPGREVEHVELVDRRRREQQRDLADLRGLRRVLDELEAPRCAGRPRPGVSARFSPTANLLVSTVAGRRGKSRRKRRAPRTRFMPPSSTLALMHRRVRPREVARRERVEHVAGGEARLALAAPVELGVGDQAVDGLARRRGGSAGRGGTASSTATPDRRSGGRAWPGRTSERPRGDARQLGAQVPGARAAARSGRRASPAATLTAAPGRTKRERRSPPRR